jgi:hypothetical protein
MQSPHSRPVRVALEAVQSWLRPLCRQSNERRQGHEWRARPQDHRSLSRSARRSFVKSGRRPRGADPEHSAPLLLELRQTALLEGNPNGAIGPKYSPNGQMIVALKTGVFQVGLWHTASISLRCQTSDAIGVQRTSRELIKSLSRPGGNATGVTSMFGGLADRQGRCRFSRPDLTFPIRVARLYPSRHIFLGGSICHQRVDPTCADPRRWWLTLQVRWSSASLGATPGLHNRLTRRSML